MEHGAGHAPVRPARRTPAPAREPRPRTSDPGAGRRASRDDCKRPEHERGAHRSAVAAGERQGRGRDLQALRRRGAQGPVLHIALHRTRDRGHRHHVVPLSPQSQPRGARPPGEGAGRGAGRWSADGGGLPEARLHARGARREPSRHPTPLHRRTQGARGLHARRLPRPEGNHRADLLADPPSERQVLSASGEVRFRSAGSAPSARRRPSTPTCPSAAATTCASARGSARWRSCSRLPPCAGTGASTLSLPSPPP